MRESQNRVGIMNGKEMDIEEGGWKESQAEESRIFMDYGDIQTDTYHIDPRTVDLEFDEIFHEPMFYLKDGKKFSFLLGDKAIRAVYGTIYTYTQLGVYYVLSVIIGLFLAPIFGTIFGLIEVVTIWVINPMLKLFFGYLRVFYLINKAVIRTALNPLFQAIGLSLSYIRINVNLTSAGLGDRLKVITDQPASAAEKGGKLGMDSGRYGSEHF